jgi:type III secretory pathway component EscS
MNGIYPSHTAMSHINSCLKLVCVCACAFMYAHVYTAMRHINPCIKLVCVCACALMYAHINTARSYTYIYTVCSSSIRDTRIINSFFVPVCMGLGINLSSLYGSGD